MFKDEIKPLSRKTDIVTQDTGEEILIYDLIANKAYNLNQTSALIWQLCDGKNSVSDITNHLAENLNSPITEEFVWLGLEQLNKDNLLENKSEVIPNFNGLSRRDVIKKVGFASLVALPVVSSLIAPAAANAQSTSCVVGPGSLICRCPCATPNGSSCGQGTTLPVPNAQCNPGCTCTRSGGACPGTGPSAGTAAGGCSAV